LPIHRPCQPRQHAEGTNYAASVGRERRGRYPSWPIGVSGLDATRSVLCCLRQRAEGGLQVLLHKSILVLLYCYRGADTPTAKAWRVLGCLARPSLEPRRRRWPRLSVRYCVRLYDSGATRTTTIRAGVPANSKPFRNRLAALRVHLRRSASTTTRPALTALASRILRKRPHPASEIDFASGWFRTMPRMFSFSTASYASTRCVSRFLRSHSSPHVSALTTRRIGTTYCVGSLTCDSGIHRGQTMSKMNPYDHRKGYPSEACFVTLPSG
jgi:hypothetical protein